MSRALLLAAAGTSSAEAAGALANIERLARARLPGIPIRWAYTSRGVLRKLAAAGRPVDAPDAALARLRAEGVRRVAVQSLHLADGMEYGELRNTVAAAGAAPDGLERIALGRPMLEDPGFFPAVTAALLRELPEPAAAGATVLLVAHGSRESQARPAYEAAAAFCRTLTPPVRLGTLLAPIPLERILRECRQLGATRACLVPLTIAAGSSATREIAGPDPASWQTALEKAGIACTTALRGLGDYDTIAQLWVDRAEALLGEIR